MIIIDSSVWIDWFKGRLTRQTDFMNDHTTRLSMATVDLVVAEVLQGYKNDRDFWGAKQEMLSVPVYDLGGEEAAIQSAIYYRQLRKKGLTVRGTIDVLIATFCIEHQCALLYSDRDFDIMVKHLGLKSALGRMN